MSPPFPELLAITLWLGATIAAIWRGWGYSRVGDPTGTLLPLAWVARLAFAWGMTAWYLWLQPGGDLNEHYAMLRQWLALFGTDGDTAWRLYTTYDPRTLPDYDALSARYIRLLPYLNDPESLHHVRLLLPLGLLGGGTLFGTVGWVALLSMAALWYTYRTLAWRYPTAKLSFAAIWLFYPSGLFWANGLQKEALLLSALGITLAALLRLRADVPVTQRWGGLAVAAAVLVLCLPIRHVMAASVLLAMCLAFLWLGLRALWGHDLPAQLALALLLVLGSGGIWLGLHTHPYLFHLALVTRADHLVNALQAGASHVVDIGNFHLTVWGVWAQVPAALGAVWLWPLPWRVQDGWTALYSLENVLIALWVVIFLVQLSRRKRWSELLGKPVSIALLVTGLALTTYIGLSIVTAGSIARYKVLGVPLVLTALTVATRRRLSRTPQPEVHP